MGLPPAHFAEKELTMIIRLLEERDVAQLAQLYVAFFGEQSDVEKMTRQLQLLRQVDTHILLAAEVDGQLAGISFRKPNNNFSKVIIL